MNTFTFNIYKDGKLLKTLENQTNDANLYRQMQRIQSSSVSWALRYEGYKFECINEQTNEKEVSKVINSMVWEWQKAN